jgi:hypothetical protein
LVGLKLLLLLLLLPILLLVLCLVELARLLLSTRYHDDHSLRARTLV